jgi:hypothetical protein
MLATDTWAGDEGAGFDDEDLHPWTGKTETAKSKMTARTDKDVVVRRIASLSETQDGSEAWLVWSSVDFRNLILAASRIG